MLALRSDGRLLGGGRLGLRQRDVGQHQTSADQAFDRFFQILGRFQRLDFFLKETPVGKREYVEHDNSIGVRFQLFDANNCVLQKLSNNWNLTPIKYESYRRG